MYLLGPWKSFSGAPQLYGGLASPACLTFAGPWVCPLKPIVGACCIQRKTAPSVVVPVSCSFFSRCILLFYSVVILRMSNDSIGHPIMRFPWIVLVAFHRDPEFLGLRLEAEVRGCCYSAPATMIAVGKRWCNDADRNIPRTTFLSFCLCSFSQGCF